MTEVIGSNQPLMRHGGDIAWAERRFGRPAAGWLDLSTGINPVPYPVPPLPGELWTRLPTAADEGALRSAAAMAYGAPGAACVAAAPGSQSLIQLLPRLRPPGSVAVLTPTYGEHAICWTAAGHRVAEASDLQAPADVVVVTNPNNPDGRRLPPDRLVTRARELASTGGWLVVDEAFADVAPELSVAAAADAPGLVVLRSFGKFFGLGGLRLGFALAEPRLAGLIRDALGSWAVAGPALAIGRQALADEDWVRKTRVRLKTSAKRLDDLLSEAGLEIVGGTDLFRLGRLQAAADLFEGLGRRGILVRPFADRPDRLRFGLPGDAAAWSRLEQAVEAWRCAEPSLPGAAAASAAAP